MNACKSCIFACGCKKKTTYEEYERPTTVLLPDESLKKLEQGTKDDVVLFLEKQYRKSSIKFQKLRFTTESDCPLHPFHYILYPCCEREC